MYAEAIVIYADVLFLINFSLDYLCLFISGRLMNRGGKFKRMATASALGGIYAFIPYAFNLPIYFSLPLHLITALGICIVAFGKSDAKKQFATAGTFIVTSALLGGLMTGMFNLISQYSLGRYTEISSAGFLIALIFSAAIALAYGFICRRKIYLRSAEIRIYVKDERFDLRLLADSGNLVTEPFSSLPVIIVSSTALPTPYDSPEREAFPLPLRVIPFSTGAGSNCFMGFRPDKIELKRLSKKPKRIQAYVGIDTGNTGYSGYDGLIPTSLL